MSDLIDRHEAIRDIRLMDVCVMYDDMCSTEEAVEKAIVATKRTVIFGLECMHSAEPRKKGKWIYYDPNGFKCSRCGSYLEIECGDVKMNFCPHCDSCMKGDE